MRSFNASDLFQSLASDEKGNVALMFGLMASIAMGILGLGLDFGRAAEVRSNLQSAADAAALAAAADVNYSNGQVKQFAETYVAVNDAKLNKMVLGDVTVTRDTSVGSSVTVNVAAKVPTTFMGLFGRKTLDIGVTATASSAITDVEITALIDMSESLGIAANDAARAQLEALTAP